MSVDFISLCIGPDGIWILIFGKGFSIIKDYPVLFSERNGLTKRYRFGRWSLRFVNHPMFVKDGQ